MSNKNNIDNINLKIEAIIPANREIIIKWSSDEGFGEYSLFADEKNDWTGDSEYMDKNDDKDFLNKLLQLFIEKIKIIG